MQRIAQQLLIPGRGAAKPAKRPGRALPRCISTKLRLDLAWRHTLVVVPVRIVGANVLEAEPPVIFQIPTRLRRAVLAKPLATRHVAWPAWRRGRVGSVGPGPGGTLAHGALMGSLLGAGNWVLAVSGERPICRQCNPALQGLRPFLDRLFRLSYCASRTTVLGTRATRVRSRAARRITM